MAAGSAVAMLGGPSIRSFLSNSTNSTKGFLCHTDAESQATIMLSLGLIGIVANVIMMSLIIINKHLRRWSQGLIFHQGLVDCGRAAILLPLGYSIRHCDPINRCSLIETGFLLLVTVSTINMLTIVLNDSPVFPDDDSNEDLISGPILLDSPQCVFFGSFMIWFTSVTINLGPTFLSGGLAAKSEMIRNGPSCPLMNGPFRHYILNALWISINIVCVLLTLFHLHKLHRDLTKANTEAVKVAGLVTTLVHVTGSSEPCAGLSEDHRRGRKPRGIRNALEEHQRMGKYLQRIEREGIQKVKMFLIITAAYMIFWGPLFFSTLFRSKIISGSAEYEVTLQIAYLHAFVNPMLFLILHRGLRHATFRLCCGFFVDLIRHPHRNSDTQHPEEPDHSVTEETDFVVEVPQRNFLVAPPPSIAVHQAPTIAQLNQSMKSLYHPSDQRDMKTLSSVYKDTVDEEWRIISKPTSIQQLPDHLCHHRTSSQTPLAYHLNSTADAQIQFSGYSSTSE